MVVMTVAANMTAFGQFQLLKVFSPVMVTPCPAASDTTYIKIDRKVINMISHHFKSSRYNLSLIYKPVLHPCNQLRLSAFQKGHPRTCVGFLSLGRLLEMSQRSQHAMLSLRRGKLNINMSLSSYLVVR